MRTFFSSFEIFVVPATFQLWMCVFRYAVMDRNQDSCNYCSLLPILHYNNIKKQKHSTNIYKFIFNVFFKIGFKLLKVPKPLVQHWMALIGDKLYLAFIEFLASFLGSGPILTGCHMALQRAVPCKPLVTVWTLVRFFTYKLAQKHRHVSMSDA